MTKQEKEKAIIDAIIALPKSGYGEYHTYEELMYIISRVMGYKRYSYMYGTCMHFDNKDQIREIIDRMKKKNLITISKSGYMFKLNLKR